MRVCNSTRVVVVSTRNVVLTVDGDGDGWDVGDGVGLAAGDGVGVAAGVGSVRRSRCGS